jgi:hypothetical protein
MTTVADGIQFLLHHTEGSHERAKRFVHDVLDNGYFHGMQLTDPERVVWRLVEGLGWRPNQVWEAEASIHRAIDYH